MSNWFFTTVIKWLNIVLIGGAVDTTKLVSGDRKKLYWRDCSNSTYERKNNADQALNTGVPQKSFSTELGRNSYKKFYPSLAPSDFDETFKNTKCEYMPISLTSEPVFRYFPYLFLALHLLLLNL